jgi:predicted RNA-binding protein with PUA-like domain
MAHWLMKTEPEDYSYGDLERERRTIWDGVRNNAALKNLRAVRRGDDVLIYHTGKEKQVVGVAKVVKGPHPDPEADDVKLVVVELRAFERLPRPVSLKEIKGEAAFSDFDLVRQPRLSVMPVPAPLWQRILDMSRA